MEHNELKEMIPLFVFGELDYDNIIILQDHMKNCAECRAEFEDIRQLSSLLSKNKDNEINDALLRDARVSLRESLRSERNKTNLLNKISVFITDLFSTNYKLVYTGAASLALGLIIGYFFFNTPPHIIVENNSDVWGSMNREIKIDNINFLDSDASDGEVEFTFEAVRPVKLKGNVNDPEIQRILTYSMLNEDNAGARLNSVNLISSAKSDEFDEEIKTALITVAQYDQNPGVRREALLLLRQTQYDDKIKDMLLYVLTNDENSALRIEAINSLSEAVKSGHKLNSNEINMFKTKVEQDDNSYIRLHAKTVLQELN